MSMAYNCRPLSYLVFRVLKDVGNAGRRPAIFAFSRTPMFDNKWHDGLTVWGYGGTVFQSEKCGHFSSRIIVPSRWRVGPRLGVAAKRQPKLNADDVFFFARIDKKNCCRCLRKRTATPRRGPTSGGFYTKAFVSGHESSHKISYLLSLIFYLPFRVGQRAKK